MTFGRQRNRGGAAVQFDDGDIGRSHRQKSTH
jgi:hypothetical protein